MQHTAAPTARTAYDLIGGEPAVRQVVDRFYDLMEDDPAYAQLRALHAVDLDPMRASLTGFLVAWLGGPKDWFDQRAGLCIMSAHREVPMAEAVARQWAEAMTRAIEERVDDPALGPRMAQALSSMALGMGGVPNR